MNESISRSETKAKEWVSSYNAATDAIYLAGHISHNFNESLVPDIQINPKALSTGWFDPSFRSPEQIREINTKEFGRPYNLNPMPAWFLEQQDHVTERTLFRRSHFIYTGSLLLRSGELVQFKQSMVDKHANNGQADNIQYRVLNASTMKEPLVIKELLIDFANNNSISIPTQYSTK